MSPKINSQTVAPCPGLQPLKAKEVVMELSPEEKKKIYEEEKARVEAQEKEKPVSIKNPRVGKMQQLLGGLLLIIGVIVLVATKGGPTGCVMSFLGFVFYVVGRFRHWWYWK